MILSEYNLSIQDINQIKRLLTLSKHDSPELEDIWKMMDIVWDELGCNNYLINWDKISEYYRHPVWLLNGLFIEQHELSLQHRNAISDWIAAHKIHSVLDFGGGFGTLSRMIAEKNRNIMIDIYEPYPCEYAMLKTKPYPNIRFINLLNREYDCLVSLDVLEHVSDPLDILAKMIQSVKLGGYLIIANCFFPVIKCHLPSTFHLRYTFNKLTKLMGLNVVGSCEGSHATIYQKVTQEPLKWKKIRFMEICSKIIFWLRESNSKKFKYLCLNLFKNPYNFAKLMKNKFHKTIKQFSIK